MSKPSNKNDLDNLISALPDKKVKKTLWTMQEDAALLKYGESKGVAAIAEALNKSKTAAYGRYRFLKANSK